jgi:inorganic pyrophosphatase
MSAITVTVEATIGSTIRRDGVPDALSDAEQDDARGAAGWPVGKGRVADTLGDDGRPVEALVLMREPAVAGADVRAWPVGVLHLAGPQRAVDEVLCVAEAPCFADLVDVSDLPRWHAEPEVWAVALSRLSRGPAYRVAACGPVREADALLSTAHHTYLQLTGCLE